MARKGYDHDEIWSICDKAGVQVAAIASVPVRVGLPGELEMRENHSHHWCAESALTTTYLLPSTTNEQIIVRQIMEVTTWYKIFLLVQQVSLWEGSM